MVRFVIAWMVLMASAAQAVEVGNPKQGLQIARDACAQCHAIGKGARRSPRSDAASFETIANTPGINSMALSAALQTSHRTMPNLVVKGQDASDIIAYILSLKKTN